MVLVIMEAHVPEKQWGTLERAFSHAMKHRPAGIISSLLAHDIHDATLWRISTLWISHEAAMTLYDSGTTMPSMYAFHLLGIVPDITISDVIGEV